MVRRYGCGKIKGSRGCIERLKNLEIFPNFCPDCNNKKKNGNKEKQK